MYTVVQLYKGVRAVLKGYAFHGPHVFLIDGLLNSVPLSTVVCSFIMKERTRSCLQNVLY